MTDEGRNIIHLKYKLIQTRKRRYLFTFLPPVRKVSQFQGKFSFYIVTFQLLTSSLFLDIFSSTSSCSHRHHDYLMMTIKVMTRREEEREEEKSGKMFQVVTRGTSEVRMIIHEKRFISRSRIKICASLTVCHCQTVSNQVLFLFVSVSPLPSSHHLLLAHDSHSRGDDTLHFFTCFFHS